MAKELEAKFALPGGFQPVRAALAALGARREGGRFERNVVFDTPDRSLRTSGRLLRLRQAGKVVLTYKEPLPQGAPSGVKAMEEIETLVDDFEATRRILAGLGYRESLWYEKCREKWRTADSLVCLDLLPFGAFMEIEGNADSIARTAAALGHAMTTARAVTYHDLFQEHLAASGLPVSDSFVFAEADKARVEAFLEAARLD